MVKPKLLIVGIVHVVRFSLVCLHIARYFLEIFKYPGNKHFVKYSNNLYENSGRGAGEIQGPKKLIDIEHDDNQPDRSDKN